MLDDGRMACVKCGSTWREFDAGLPRTTSNKNRPARLHLAPGVKTLQPGSLWTGGLRKAGFAAIAAAVFFGAFHLVSRAPDFSVTTGSVAPVELSVTDALQVERDGRVAVRVQGRIINTGPKPLRLEPVEVVLLRQDDQRFYRWTYRPGIIELQPGATLRFSTANGNVPRLAGRVEIGHSGMTVSKKL